MLDAYRAALAKGWSPDNVVDRSAAELEAIERDSGGVHQCGIGCDPCECRWSNLHTSRRNPGAAPAHEGSLDVGWHIRRTDRPALPPRNQRSSSVSSRTYRLRRGVLEAWPGLSQARAGTHARSSARFRPDLGFAHLRSRQCRLPAGHSRERRSSQATIRSSALRRQKAPVLYQSDVTKLWSLGNA